MVEVKVGQIWMIDDREEIQVISILKNDLNKYKYLIKYENGEVTRCKEPYFSRGELKSKEENTMQEERTYSNAEIMEMMDNGEFNHGDSINQELYDGLVLYDENEESFYFGNNPAQFNKGERWTIERAEKWQDIAREEAPGILQHADWSDVRCTLDGECRTMKQWLAVWECKGYTRMNNLYADGEWEVKK